MEKNAFIKFLIPLVLACLHNETRVCAKLPKRQVRLLKHLQREEFWQDNDNMWFVYFLSQDTWWPVSSLWEGNYRVGTETRLKMVPPLMGCAYGVNLNYYHLLTFKVIEVCNEMRKDNDDRADECTERLRNIVQVGKLVVVKLIKTLNQIYSALRLDVGVDRFYTVLFPLEEFLQGPINVEFAGILPGGLAINTLFNGAAEALRELLIETCYPNYQPFDITAITSEYDGENHPKGIYDFYLEKLNSYIGHVDRHLTLIGIY